MFTLKSNNMAFFPSASAKNVSISSYTQRNKNKYTVENLCRLFHVVFLHFFPLCCAHRNGNDVILLLCFVRVIAYINECGWASYIRKDPYENLLSNSFFPHAVLLIQIFHILNNVIECRRRNYNGFSKCFLVLCLFVFLFFYSISISFFFDYWLKTN